MGCPGAAVAGNEAFSMASNARSTAVPAVLRTTLVASRSAVNSGGRPAIRPVTLSKLPVLLA